MNTANTIRVNITIPKQVWSELAETAPKGEKSRFITEAIEEKLLQEKKRKAFKELATLPPTFTDIPDGAAYIRDMRHAEDKKRTTRLAV